MKKLLATTLSVILTLVAITAFGQTKPKKPVNQHTQVSQPVKPAKPLNISPACWMITGKNGDIEYRWDTEANVIQWINEMRTQHNEIYEYTRSTAKDVDACDAKNEKQNPKKCWKITAKINGQGYEQHLWSTETVARRKVASLQSNGYQQANYIETPANDEKSCAPTETEPSCWELTIGNSVSFYWGFESEVQAMINEAINSGQTATYKKTNLSKDSCIK